MNEHTNGDGFTPQTEPQAKLSVDDFVAYVPTHKYMFRANREMWGAPGVNARVPYKEGFAANEWLDKHCAVDAAVWAPGLDELIEGRVLNSGGWIKKKNARCFNLYQAPKIEPGDAKKTGPWREHLKRVYPHDAKHIEKWLAHRVQRPSEKLNHALFLGGNQGIGKDTILEPAKHGVGHENFKEISPTAVMGRFKPHLRSVVLRVSEARDLGETDRFKLYDHMKTLIAAPPDSLMCDEKNLREHYVLNVMGVIITSNYKTGGIYLHPDDRRHYVAWSEATKEEFSAEYWRTLWQWYNDGGIWHVVAYLMRLDLTGFDAKAPPPKTPAFYEIVDSNRAPEDAELSDVLDDLGNPSAVTIEQLVKAAQAARRAEICDFLNDRKNRRQIPHRMEAVGYAQIRNSAAKDGLWVITHRRAEGVARAGEITRARAAIYAKKELPVKRQIAAAKRICAKIYDQ
jgi:hypothetical protein